MPSLKVKTPNNFRPERTYIIDTILKDFLGLHYELLFDEARLNTSISLDGKEVVIEDGFWNNHIENCGYLTKDALPTVSYFKSEFTKEGDVPVLYGNGIIDILDSSHIKCGIDIFAGAFFMLTRWEEIVNEKRDKHGRFMATDSIAYKYGFLHRPIVNEYIELLWTLFEKAGFNLKRKDNQFELIPTHDIDWLEMKNHRWNSFKAVVHSIVKKRSFFQAFDYLSNLICRNPFDTFNFLIEQSRKQNLTSHFYFMAAGAEISIYNRRNYLYDKSFCRILYKIKVSNNVIGFHPSYFTATNLHEWENEFKELITVTGNVTEGRQHYLMVNVPETLRIWDNMGMSIDSSLGYADHEGFRCGTGNEYHFFDVKKRQVMNLIERPLIIMDGTLAGYRKLDVTKSLDCFKYYIEMGKRYNMPITILFHNSSFVSPMWKGWKQLYKKILSFSE